MAELASLNPPDAERLLSKVVGALRGMARAGRLHDVDRVLAGMRPSTARLITLVALSGHKSALPENLLGRMEADYEALVDRERAGEPDVLSRASEVREEVERHAAGRHAAARDRAFLSRLQQRRGGREDR
jgi:hypothetical protein